METVDGEGDVFLESNSMINLIIIIIIYVVGHGSNINQACVPQSAQYLASSPGSAHLLPLIIECCRVGEGKPGM